MSTSTGNSEVDIGAGAKWLCDGADIDLGLDNLGASPKSIPMAPKSIPLAPIAVTCPTGVTMASAGQVMTLRGDGGCIDGSRVCCSDVIAEAVWDIRGNGGSNTPKYRAEGAADPVFPVLNIAPLLGLIYPRHCLIDADHDVFEFDGSEVVLTTTGISLLRKPQGGMQRMWILRRFCRQVLRPRPRRSTAVKPWLRRLAVVRQPLQPTPPTSALR